MHEVRFILTRDLPPVSAELATACLIDRQLVERALEREKMDREQIAGAFRWYGRIADIHPCVFNGAVDVYETVRSAGLSPESDAFAMFDRSYRFETENGQSLVRNWPSSYISAIALSGSPHSTKTNCFQNSAR